MFNKKKFKDVWREIQWSKMRLDTMQFLSNSLSDSLSEILKRFEKTDTRIEKLERVTESDTNSIVNLSNKLEEKDKMIESLREEVSEIREVVKEFLKISGYKTEMVRNENYMQAHSIKITKIDNPSNKKI